MCGACTLRLHLYLQSYFVLCYRWQFFDSKLMLSVKKLIRGKSMWCPNLYDVDFPKSCPQCVSENVGRGNLSILKI